MAEIDTAQQSLEAQEAGIAEVCKLLQHPDDLSKLPSLLLDYESKLQVSKTTVTNLVQSQVEAARQGLELLDRSQRHIVKLRSCLDKIEALCQESDALIDNADTIKTLSMAHSNIKKVLTELRNIIHLPKKAEEVVALMKDPSQLLPAFERLTVLEGTAENVKQAWHRNIGSQHDISDMMRFLSRVGEAMEEFEGLLWATLANHEGLAQQQPTLLVDCLRVVELQERLDAAYSKTKMRSEPKGFRAKLMRLIRGQVEERFEPLEELAGRCGQFNVTVKYDQHGDLILDAQRDYLGNLTLVRKMDRGEGKEVVLTKEEELGAVDIIEEEVFDEGEYLDEVLDLLSLRQAELALVYDFVAPCFPPSYNIFDTWFQLYHVHVATVVDELGQHARDLSTKGALRVVEWIRNYMDTLRNLGVEEDLVRLPPSPGSDPESKPGLDMLVGAYIDRMYTTVTAWYSNILAADLQKEPRPGPTGHLMTPGVVDFFRIMNEQIQVIQGINDHGDVMFNTAQCALRIMQGFQKAQGDVISERPLSFEMCCAFVNNNVECHDQSLEYAEDVKRQLEPRYQAQLDIEDVCRGFLDVAKLAARRAVVCMFNDPGFSTLLKVIFTGSEWLSGMSTPRLVATIADYMQDVSAFVHNSFVKRVAEFALEEYVRRAVNMFVIGMPQPSPALAQRMEKDEQALEEYFEKHLKTDRLAKALQQLADLREIVAGTSPPSIALAFSGLAASQPAFTLEAVQKLLPNRTDLSKKEIKEAMGLCMDVWKQRAAAAAAASGGSKEEKRGLFGWGKKAAT